MSSTPKNDFRYDENGCRVSKAELYILTVSFAPLLTHHHLRNIKTTSKRIHAHTHRFCSKLLFICVYVTIRFFLFYLSTPLTLVCCTIAENNLQNANEHAYMHSSSLVSILVIFHIGSSCSDQIIKLLIIFRLKFAVCRIRLNSIIGNKNTLIIRCFCIS